MMLQYTKTRIADGEELLGIYRVVSEPIEGGKKAAV